MDHSVLKQGQSVSILFVFGSRLLCKFVKDYDETILISFKSKESNGIRSRMIYKSDIEWIHNFRRVK